MKKKRHSIKSKQVQLLEKFLHMIVMSIIGLFVSFIIFVLLLLLFLLKPPSFSPEQVLKTCELMNLPSDSSFCSHFDNQTSSSFMETLLQYYPINSTKITDFNLTIPDEMYCNQNTQTCSIWLPKSSFMLEIQYDKNDYVSNYQFMDHN